MASISRALERIKQDLDRYVPQEQIIQACRQIGHTWRIRKRVRDRIAVSATLPMPNSLPIFPVPTQYGYDRDSNVLYKRNQVNTALSELYHLNGPANGYDTLNRLTGFTRGTLSDTNADGIPDTATAVTITKAWDLDPLGNWDSVTTNSTNQTYDSDEQNELTQAGPTALQYDANGNTHVDERGTTYIYDAWNRQMTATPAGTTYHETCYTYDALGRRVTALDTVRQTTVPVLVVNDGSTQRSMVNSLSVVFDHAVSLATGAITLVQRNVGSVPISISNPSGDNRTFLISFTGSGLIGGSLADGIYDLSLHGNLVQDIGGGFTTADRLWTFHRLFGDLDGNKTVTAMEALTFRSLVPTASGSPAYRWEYDYDQNGTIDDADYDCFKSRVGQRVIYTSTSTPLFIGAPATAAMLSSSTFSNQRRQFLYSAAWQVLEERGNGAGNALVQYVWSPAYVNCMIERDRDADHDAAHNLEERLYVLQDANYNVSAILSSSGTVLERFVYDPYGARTILNATWQSTTDTYVFGQGFQGGFVDSTTTLILFQHRDYSPTLGRWLQQDPAGYVDGANLYQMERSNPVNAVDPWGLDAYVYRDPDNSWGHVFVQVDVRDASGQVVGQLQAALNYDHLRLFGGGPVIQTEDGNWLILPWLATGPSRIDFKFGKAGKSMVGKPDRVIKGCQEDDQRLIDFLLAAAEAPPDWLVDATKAGQAKQCFYPSAIDNSWRYYSAFSQNCVDFVDAALDVYTDSNWCMEPLITSSLDLIQQIDERFNLDGTKKVPKIDTWDLIDKPWHGLPPG